MNEWISGCLFALLPSTFMFAIDNCRLISSVTKRSNVIVTRHKGCCVQQLSYLLIYSHFSTTRHHRRRHWLIWISSMSWKIFTSIIVLNFQKCLWVISIIDRHWSWPWKKVDVICSKIGQYCTNCHFNLYNNSLFTMVQCNSWLVRFINFLRCRVLKQLNRTN